MFRALILLCLLPTALGAGPVDKPRWDLTPTKAWWDTSKIPAVKCLADNIYHEARGESRQGQQAVAHVVLNRVKNPAWGGHVCGVVWAKAQFSWTLDKRLWNIRDPKAYERAKLVALEVLAGKTRDMTGGATHYYEPTKVNPSWATSGVNKRFVGSHVFMKMKGGGV